VKRFLVALSLALGSSLCLFGAGAKTAKEFILVDGQRRSYYLFVPTGTADSASLPLLVLLHGSGRDGTSLIEKWKGLASKSGIILVGPNSLNPAGWAAPADGPGFLRTVVEALKKVYPVNPRRTYLFGHSGGGVFALVMSCWDSEFFAAASAHAAALRGPSELQVVSVAKRRIPIQLVVGTRDPFFPVNLVRATRDEFLNLGFPTELKEIPGHDHSYYSLSSVVNDAVWGFLKDKELPSDPK
jgi:poly(3-hydroxybutyrate) depolymerase